MNLEDGKIRKIKELDPTSLVENVDLDFLNTLAKVTCRNSNFDFPQHAQPTARRGPDTHTDRQTHASPPTRSPHNHARAREENDIPFREPSGAGAFLFPLTLIYPKRRPEDDKSEGWVGMGDGDVGSGRVTPQIGYP